MEKVKSRPPPYEGECPKPPSPPSCDEKWKLAHLGSLGFYTSDTAQEISQKIVFSNFSLIAKLLS